MRAAPRKGGSARTQFGDGRPGAGARKSLYMRMLAVLAVALGLAGPASAGGIVVHLTFAPGSLSLAAPAARVAASGTLRVQVTVADGRGSGAGWRLRSVSGTPLAVASIAAVCASGSTCTLPKAAAPPSGSTVLRAAKGTGMGVMRLTVTLTGAPGTPVAFAVS